MRKTLTWCAVGLLLIVTVVLSLTACGPTHSTTAAKPAPAPSSSAYSAGYAYGKTVKPSDISGSVLAYCKAAATPNATETSWVSGCAAGVATHPGEVQQIPKPTPTPAPKPKPAPKPTVTFIVYGSPADVTYGASNQNLTGSVPMRKTVRLNPGASYYSIDAQLQGSGTVTCEIAVNGHVISTAEGQGGYNLADCEISPAYFDNGVDNTGWDADQ